MHAFDRRADGQTDRQTDRWTDTFLIAIASEKKWVYSDGNGDGNMRTATRDRREWVRMGIRNPFLQTSIMISGL